MKCFEITISIVNVYGPDEGNSNFYDSLILGFERENFLNDIYKQIISLIKMIILYTSGSMSSILLTSRIKYIFYFV